MVQGDGITDLSVIRGRYLINGCFTEEILWVKETPREVRSTDRRRIKHKPARLLPGIERPPEINNTVTMNHLGHFYLCVSVPLDIIDNQDDVHEDGSGREQGEEHLTQIVSGGSGFGLTSGLEPLWDTI
ncbi:891_t:CDS:2 [Funneliformis mosseae]|uniref:891_t:CDS:1 n=1 Tax=Funneliformis mosseae TaxID=27381 RepID=A0A9N8ZZR6_FUNMO|nr:891_t:CDS:2 [Funneliformis mosseae]